MERAGHWGWDLLRGCDRESPPLTQLAPVLCSLLWPLPCVHAHVAALSDALWTAIPLGCPMPPGLCGLGASPPHRLVRSWRDGGGDMGYRLRRYAVHRLVIVSRSHVWHVWLCAFSHSIPCGHVWLWWVAETQASDRD